MRDERERRLEHTGILAEASDAIITTLATRLDVLLASWQRAVDAEGKAPLKLAEVKPRPAADVLWELQGMINHLDLHIDELRREVDSESHQATDWDQRAIIALGDNREDLAAQALREKQDHAHVADSLDREAVELEAVRDTYRRAIAAVEASLDRKPPAA